MLRISICCAAVLSLVSCAVTKPPAGVGPLKTVSRVEVERYSGKWFEIARYPQWFQRGCVSATAEYTKLENGSLKVVNTCIREDGSTRSIAGTAEPVTPDANRLRVRFTENAFARLAPVPEEGNYWIIHVSKGYRHAIVGTPDRKSLWFLSRSTAISQRDFDALKKVATEQGFDTSKLVVDDHTKVGGD